MANFTSDQIDNCTIQVITKHYDTDNKFSHWVYLIADDDGFNYSLEDYNTAGNASKATIKTAIKYILTKTHKFNNPQIVDVPNKGVGETLA